MTMLDMAYKGVYNGEDIAIKLLHHMPGGFEDDPFGSEFVNLMSIKHPHVVRLVGYCYEIQHKHVNYKGVLRFSQYIHRALCFEYLQGGSLDRYLDACDKGSRDYNWRTHFNIIKGVCEGLNFLHNGCGSPILHLDLKPANILLDKNMVAKIADFGLSRLFSGEKTHITETTKGTAKYMPPEHEYKQMISPKNDVFSLGVIIIEVMDGPTGYCNFREIDDVKQFINLVNMKWSKRINATKSPCPSAELEQVETCIEIAIKCVDHERNNRPTVAEIVHILQETENKFLEVWRSHNQFPMDQYLPTFQELIAGENSTSSLQQAGSEDPFSVINLRTQMVLPPRVCFKGENGYYLRARSIEGNNYLEFSSDGIDDSTVRHSIHQNGDGTIRIKSDHFGKFWRRGPKWIWADSVDTSSNNPDTLFRVVKAGNIYALQNLGNNKYCKRLTDEGKVSCLCAAVPTMNEWTHLQVEEPVLSRRIYNIEYQVQNAKIYDEKVLSMNSTENVNHGSNANKTNVTLHYSVRKTKTWESSISVKLGVTTTLEEAGVPEIVDGSVLIQSKYSSSYTWGDSMTNTVVHSMEYEVVVPPKTKVTLRPLVAEATCEVPFSYHQEDVLMDGQKVVYKLDDGIYRGVNSYNFTYDTTEESLEDISPQGLTEESFGNISRHGPSRRHVLKHLILFILQVCWCLPGGKPQE